MFQHLSASLFNTAPSDGTASQSQMVLLRSDHVSSSVSYVNVCYVPLWKMYIFRNPHPTIHMREWPTRCVLFLTSIHFVLATRHYNICMEILYAVGTEVTSWWRTCWLETSRGKFKPLTPNEPCSGRTAPLTSKRCILYIYSTNIGTKYFKHGIYSPFFSSSKCSLFHNFNVFGSYIIHILYTGYAKIKRK